VLHDVEGFEHHEIATMLGISEGTSKSQVHKARMKLRGILNGGTSARGIRRAAQAGRL
jgi:RNA polymerase sigma-70 factor (ECF subfamily)